MSKFCIIVFPNVSFDTLTLLREKIVEIANMYNKYVFWDFEYQEPFLENYPNSIAISISDSFNHDNCEMFLLPDNFTYNNLSNSNLFIERMKLLQDCVYLLLKYTGTIELFLGDSGTKLSDFKVFNSSVSNLAKDINCYYLNDNYQENNLHFVIKTL